MSGERKDRNGNLALGAGALPIAACCGSHLLALGVIGGVAAGSVFGVFFGVLAGLVVAVAPVAALLVARRRRRAADCHVAFSSPANRKAVSHER